MRLFSPLLVALLVCAVHGLDLFDTSLDAASNVLDFALERGRGKRSNDEAIIIAKLFVPACKHDEFIDEWEKIYGEWKSWDAYLDHTQSSSWKAFNDWLADNQIEAKRVPFRRVSAEDVHHKKHKSSKNQAHVVFSVWVEPGHHRDFISRWEKLAKETSREKGVHIFSLRKSEVDNVLFTVYGTWDSLEDMHKHHWSKHTHEFRRWKAKHNVVWKMWPLYKIGHQPE